MERLTFHANGRVYSRALTEMGTLYRLAELEDKLESGLLIELPCKVGDKAWFIVNNAKSSRIEETYVTDIVIYDSCIDIGVSQSARRLTFKSNGEVFNPRDLYLNKTQAEARLKELRGE